VAPGVALDIVHLHSDVTRHWDAPLVTKKQDIGKKAAATNDCA
jgi:hypothetical protein